MTDKEQIKAYVIKNKNCGGYLSNYGNRFHLDDRLTYAMIFDDETQANNIINLYNSAEELNLVPITIQEGDNDEELINIHKDILTVINGYRFNTKVLIEDFVRMLNELKTNILNGENVENRRE